jgi:nicotinate-nucleotide pyrophosphorylase (carboxylating)
VTGFSAAETAACGRLIDLALREDLGGEPTWRGDVTSFLLIPPGYRGQATVIARKPGVVAGMPAAALVAGSLGTELKLQTLVPDTTSVMAGARLATLIGPVQQLLTVERTLLNFLQHLSGIATLTRAYVNAVKGLPVQILDTRKTTPAWRLLEKYAVRCGGGHNHRVGLYDAILIKDNHREATSKTLSIADAIHLAKRGGSTDFHVAFVEIEVDTLDQLDEALPARPDIILLDNMLPSTMREAVQRRNAVAPGVLLEASGGVTLETVRAIAETGVDRISVGALTHSAPALDIALDFARP